MDSKVEHFAPSIKVPTSCCTSETITPKGYEWVLAFAIKGVPWAIEKASTPEFRQMVLDDLRNERREAVKRMIDGHLGEIDDFRKELRSLDEEKHDGSA